MSARPMAVLKENSPPKLWQTTAKEMTAAKKYVQKFLPPESTRKPQAAHSLPPFGRWCQVQPQASCASKPGPTFGGELDPGSKHVVVGTSNSRGHTTKRGLRVPNPKSRGHTTKRGLRVPNPNSRGHATKRGLRVPNPKSRGSKEGGNAVQRETKSEWAASPLPSRGPKGGRICYVTPAFSGFTQATTQDRNHLRAKSQTVLWLHAMDEYCTPQPKDSAPPRGHTIDPFPQAHTTHRNPQQSQLYSHRCRTQPARHEGTNVHAPGHQKHKDMN